MKKLNNFIATFVVPILLTIIVGFIAYKIASELTDK
jgi:hypothetical protein